MAAWLVSRADSRAARAGGVVLILGGVILSALRNLHGPPILVGAILAAWFLWRDRDAQSAVRGS
jgi:4-amino-4-deoxy-L-arabinose transferase-like glycosyltransferase